jgi:hypothetical protein
MRRLVALGAVSLVSSILALAPSGASAAFTQCPPVYRDTSCQFLFTVTDSETSVEADPTQGPYEGIEDALIGVQNNSSKAISSLPISAEAPLFGFEIDGICTPGEPPVPSGCQVLTYNSSEEKLANAGEPCPSAFNGEPCGFPEPAGEPAGVTFPEGILFTGYGKQKNPITGYEGPTSWFTGIVKFGAFEYGSGVVNFSPAIPPGGSTYFSLESPPAGGFGGASTLTTTLSGGGHTGASISVVTGTPVTDTATLGGEGSANATGKVTFKVYSDAACTKPAAEAGVISMAKGVAGPSSAVTLGVGTYYWQASYGGNNEHQAALSACGSEVLTVQAPTSTTTVQSGAGVKFSSIAVPVGSSVTDSAKISGPLAATSGGSVVYSLYKNNKCTPPAIASSVATVVKGAAGPSAAVTPAAGKYYWIATYSGDASNAPSASACGSEVLIVAKKLALGLKVVKGCVSRRHITVHPHAPKGAKLAKVEEFINGKLVFSGKLHGRSSSVNLRGLPKGTYVVQLVVTDSKGKLYEDTRRFKTCAKKKHHKKH